LAEIKKIKKINIKKTKLIYKFDIIHQKNPHESIDNIPNIFVVLELVNGKILGAFTQMGFNKDENQLL
jgi:hypothetical protein